MTNKIEVTVDTIVHATEDVSKIFQTFEEILNLKEEYFTIQETIGHFENPIILLNTTIVKKQAEDFMEKLLDLMSSQQINELIKQIEERTIDSRFHLRLDKQELIKGKLVIREKDTIKIKIHTPIYNKKDTVKAFTKIFQISN